MNRARNRSGGRHPAQRRGGVYVLVLVVTTIVSSMALLGLRAAMMTRSEGDWVVESITSRENAVSAMEVGLHTIMTEPQWRAERSSGEWLTKVALGTGTLTVMVEAVGGGAYSTSPLDPVQVTGYGYEDGARSMLRAQVTMEGLSTRDHIELLYAASPVAYWPIDGAEDEDYDAEDVDDNDLTKSWSGSQIIPGVVPGLGMQTASWFDGTGGSMEAASSSSYQDIRTVSVWFWVSSTTGLQGIVTRDASGRGAGGRWELAVYNGELESLYDTSSRTVTLRGGTVETDQWNHAVLTIADDQMRLYLNGARVDSWSSILLASELVGIAPTETVRIGVSRRTTSATADGTNPIKGAVCELALLKSPMSDAEVLALYDAYPAPARYAVMVDSWERVVE